MPSKLQFKLILLGVVTICVSSVYAEATHKQERAKAYTGRVVEWVNGKPVEKVVSLPPFIGGFFRNKLLHFEKLPKDLRPDENGCFCFKSDDPRFLYVHVFYHAYQQIKYFNKKLKDVRAPITGMLIRPFRVSENEAPSASATGRDMVIHFNDPVFDPSILAHELGHSVHLYGMGTLEGAHWKPKSEAENTLRAFAEWQGVSEGLANIMAYFYSGDTRIAPRAWLDAFLSIDDKVHYSKLPTRLEFLRKRTHSKQFRKKYPIDVRNHLKEVTETKGDKELEALPSPYLSSTVFTRPLVLAAKKFGKDKVETLVFQSLAESKFVRTYPELAKLFLSNSKDKELKEFLRSSFKKRGLIK